MADILEIKKRPPVWPQLGQLLAQPFAQRQAQEQSMYSTLMPLIFKAQLERQNKMNELELEHQYEMRKIQDFKNINKDAHVRAKLQGGKIVLESIDKKQLGEEAAVERSPQFGKVLSYTQSASRRGAPENVMREATARYSTPEEIKSIMGAYGAGTKLRPKLPQPMRTTTQSITAASGAEEVLKEIGDLKTILKKEPKGFFAKLPYFGTSAQATGVKAPFAPFGITEKGQEYRTLRESINNRLLYLRSGAQINDKEFKRLSGMLPEIFRSDKVDLQQLDRFENEFRGILKRLNTKSVGNELSAMSEEELRELAGL